MANPIGRIPAAPGVLDVVTRQRATENQAKVTGGASNYAGQANIQAADQMEARRRASINLLGRKGTTATLAALTLLPDMGRSRTDEDDEGEPEGPPDPHGRPKRGRRIKR